MSNAERHLAEVEEEIPLRRDVYGRLRRYRLGNELALWFQDYAGAFAACILFHLVLETSTGQGTWATRLAVIALAVQMLRWHGWGLTSGRYAGWWSSLLAVMGVVLTTGSATGLLDGVGAVAAGISLTLWPLVVLSAQKDTETEAVLLVEAGLGERP